MMYRRLPSTTQNLYSELLERAIQCEANDILGVAGSGTFVSKEVKGHTYWYLQKSEGRRRRQIYLGPDSSTLTTWMENVAEERQSSQHIRSELAQLAAMLIAGGIAPEWPGIAKVLEILREARVFRLGGVLVGTVAFRVYGPVLGVSLEGATVRTDDVDVAHEPDLAVGLVPRYDEQSVADHLLGSAEGIQPIPALDPRTPSTSFSIRSRDLRLDFLAPASGRGDDGPVFIPAFGLSATPLRFLEYLIEAPIQAVVVAGQPVLVNVPQPARFAVHKLYSSQRRSAAFQTKAAKDLRQARSLIEVLAVDRPGDLLAAWQALEAYPNVYRELADLLARIEGPGAELLLGGGTR